MLWHDEIDEDEDDELCYFFYIYIVQLSVLADVRAAVQQGGEDQDREQYRHGRLRPRPWQVSTS